MTAVKPWACVGLVVGALVGAGCTTSAPATQGVIAGLLVQRGGPAPGSTHPVSGAVIATEIVSGHTKTAVIGTSGRFHLGVPDGTYTVSGTNATSTLACVAKKKVVIRTRTVATIEVICPAG
jgi:hypothetical protein